MTLLQILPPVAYALAGAAIFAVATGRGVDGAGAWLLPAAVGALFAGFTAVTLLREGLVVFWTNHTTTFAGNQVWFDLLIAVTVAFALISPRARAVGMPLAPWAVAVVLTASVALLPMLARLLWLERQRAGRPSGGA